MERKCVVEVNEDGSRLCGRPVFAIGVCAGHYSRMQRAQAKPAAGPKKRHRQIRPLTSPMLGPHGEVPEKEKRVLVFTRLRPTEVAALEQEAKRRKTTRYAVIREVLEAWVKENG